MPDDLLQRIRKELDERRKELRKVYEEHERLERALVALSREVEPHSRGGRGTSGRAGRRPAVGRGERVKQLLPLLVEHPEATPTELARMLDTTRANVSVTLSRLAKQGVIGRERNRWRVYGQLP